MKNYIFIILLFFFSFKNSAWFNIIPLHEILEKNKQIQYIPCFNKIYFDYKQLPFSINPSDNDNKGFLNSTFILKIPNGTVTGTRGIVFIDGCLPKEMIWRDIESIYLNIPKINLHDKNIPKIFGKIAVIAQPGYENYFHWTVEVLGRLALLEIFNIEYDYVYVPQSSKYMRETLQMWGIPEEKILDPVSDDFVIQADEIILPSLIANSSNGYTLFVNYVHPYLLDYVKNKLLKKFVFEESYNFSKRIFISRKDANIRRILNEDEIFEQLKMYGFERYELSKLSVADQIRLFRQAEIIISPQGTGLANIIYCNSHVKIIELYQALCDSAIFYMSQILNLNCIPIQTTTFETVFYKGYFLNTYMPLSIVEKIVEHLN